MAIEIKMPALSPTMTEGRLSRWLVGTGDKVASGDVIAEIETDKATMEVEAIDEGTFGAIHVQEGTDGVAVGEVIATLLEEGETEVPAPSAAAIVAEAAIETASAPVAEASAEAVSEPVSASLPATVAAPAAAPVGANPDWQGPTRTMTVREALRDAMAEEMRRDERIFVMGEEVGEYQGA